MTFAQSCRELMENSEPTDYFWDNWKYPKDFTGKDINVLNEAVRRTLIKESLAGAKDEVAFLKEIRVSNYSDNLLSIAYKIDKRIADLEEGIQILEGQE